MFANPEVIRRVQQEFVPISVAAALMHRPSSETERKLLYAIGRSGPAPQGIGVLNSDGQVLDWALMFENDEAVLDFLEHGKARYREHPDSSEPFETGRYQRYPTQKREGVAAHAEVPPALRHAAGERCPADHVYAPGTVLAQVVGRRVSEEGELGQAVVNQEDYAQDRFVMGADAQDRLWAALRDSGTERVKIPGEVASQWVAYAYLGMLDVRPLNNPSGAPCTRNEVEFAAEADPKQPGWFRIAGRRCISKLLVILLDYQVRTVAELGCGHGNRDTRAPDFGNGDGVAERLD